MALIFSQIWECAGWALGVFHCTTVREELNLCVNALLSTSSPNYFCTLSSVISCEEYISKLSPGWLAQRAVPRMAADVAWRAH